MSSILKALKKLEEEKSLLKNEKEVNLSRDILKPEAKLKRNAHWQWLLGISATTAIIVLSFALFHKSATRAAVKSPQSDISPPSSSPAPPPTVLPMPQATDGRKAAAVSSQSKKVSAQDSARPVSPPVRKVPTTEMPNSPVVTVELPKADLVPKSAPSARAHLSEEATLTLSGIAWNKDSSDRLAIINGQPTAAGATVNGALVEEILQDKVRMNLSGRTFELFLGKQTKTN